MSMRLVEKIYKYYWPKDSMRNAEIHFVGDDNGWSFRNCDYVGVSNVYTLDDFEFLRDLANEILKLEKEVK